MTLEPLILKMISYDHGSPERIQHFLKVHSFAKTIAVSEHLDEKTLFITEAAAIVHDIGIRLCLEKYGDGNGKLQEKEGPVLAEQMLSELGFEKDVIERVSFLVGHHHTYTGIDGLDYQILVEADFLVNLFEGNTDTAHIRATYDNIFPHRDRGKNLPRNVWLIMWRHHQLFFPFRGILLKGWASHKNGDAARFQDKFTVNDSHL